MNESGRGSPDPVDFAGGLVGGPTQENLDRVEAMFREELTRAGEALDALQRIRSQFFGPKGRLTQMLREVGRLPPERRREAGAAANRLKGELEAALGVVVDAVTDRAREQALRDARVDTTLPGRASLYRGALHPVTRLIDEITEIFSRLGFEVAVGPEVELDWYNFEALNFPPDHPARDMQDTFFVAPPDAAADATAAATAEASAATTTDASAAAMAEASAGATASARTGAAYPTSAGPAAAHGGGAPSARGRKREGRADEPVRVLRTHTSPVQVRAMLASGAPIRIVSPGRVYRCDSDATHSPMFHQIEGLFVDEGVSMAHLRGVLQSFVNSLFGERAMRFRPSFFPFVEPGAEVDIQCVFCGGSGRREGTACRVCKATGWLEILGAGMVHPNVLAACNIDPERYTGFAFGMGVDRVAMLRWQIDDLAHLFRSDLRFLRQL